MLPSHVFAISKSECVNIESQTSSIDRHPELASAPVKVRHQLKARQSEPKDAAEAQPLRESGLKRIRLPAQPGTLDIPRPSRALLQDQY